MKSGLRIALGAVGLLFFEVAGVHSQGTVTSPDGQPVCAQYNTMVLAPCNAQPPPQSWYDPKSWQGLGKGPTAAQEIGGLPPPGMPLSPPPSPPRAKTSVGRFADRMAAAQGVDPTWPKLPPSVQGYVANAEMSFAQNPYLLARYGFPSSVRWTENVYLIGNPIDGLTEDTYVVARAYMGHPDGLDEAVNNDPRTNHLIWQLAARRFIWCERLPARCH